MTFPKGWSTEAPKAVTASTATKVKAGIDMSDEVVGAGLCPDCHTQMVKGYTRKSGSGELLPTMICAPCNVALPYVVVGAESQEGVDDGTSAT